MATVIFELKEQGDGSVQRKATYTIPPKQALVAFIEQCNGNFQTWEYPNELPGMRESTQKDCWLYDDFKNKRVLAAYQM